MTNRDRSVPAILLSALAAVWLGMVVGVSFIATPVKFQAAGLDLPVALDVGRLTFGLFARVEWAMAGLATLLVVAGRVAGWRRAVMAVVVAGLALQALWLLPALEARVATIVAGRRPDPSPHHLLYATLEVAKAVGLLLVALPLEVRARGRSPAGALRVPKEREGAPAHPG